MFLGKRIKKTREEKNLTQEELGNLLGVTKVSVCNWENNKKGPSSKNLRELAKTLDVPLEYLIANDVRVIREEEKEYEPSISMASEEVEIIKELKRHPKLYEKLLENPKRIFDRIDKILFD